MGKKNKLKPTYVDFDHKNYKWKSDIDYRENPHLYEIGRGQQGVLTCEPYKSEIRLDNQESIWSHLNLDGEAH